MSFKTKAAKCINDILFIHFNILQLDAQSAIYGQTAQ